MATSGVYTFSRTATQVVGGILRWLNVLAEGQSPSNQQIQDVIEALNYFMSQQKGPANVTRPGQLVWLRETAELDLVSGQYLYELKPSGGDLAIQIPTEILSASLRTEDDEDTILEAITRAEYELIGGKTESGTPSRYCYEKRLDVGNLYLDQAPDNATASQTLRIIYRQPLEMVTTGAQTLDIDDFWYRAIKFNVALDVAAEFGVEPTQAMYDRAKESMTVVSTFYPEDTGNIFFEPDRD